MKLLLLCALVAAAAARPQNQPEVRVLDEKFEQDEQGSYSYSYELDNGQKVSEEGKVAPGPEPETGSLEVSGSYSFIGDDGITYTINYRAGEAGFQPEAAHLPVAPEQIPEYAQLRQDYPELFWAQSQ